MLARVPNLVSSTFLPKVRGAEVIFASSAQSPENSVSSYDAASKWSMDEA